MQIDSVIRELKSLAKLDKQAMSKRRGIASKSLLGVSTREIRRLAKKLGKDGELADQLWCEPFHEARLLAILVAPLSEKTSNELTDWVVEIESWDVCDQFAKRISESHQNLTDLVNRWASDEALYVRRAGLALLANYCMKQHKLEEEAQRRFVSLIEDASRDDRQHVKQACCWALRELGKIDTETHEIATNLALELAESKLASSVWVGKSAYKELELLVKIPGRRRLISRNSKSASKYLN